MRVAVLGDVDGDGVPDVLVASPGVQLATFTSGRVELRSGATGAVLRVHSAPALHDDFGERVGALGDLDGDGVSEYGIGSVWVWPDPDLGRLLLNGRCGSTTARPVPCCQLPRSPANRPLALGDADGDGVREPRGPRRRRRGRSLGRSPVSSAAALAAGEVRVLSGVDLSVRVRVVGAQARGELGHGVLVVGDLDGDGTADYAVTQPAPHFLDGSAPGVVRIFRGGTPAWVDLGWSLAGPAGAPKLAGTGVLTAGSPFALDVSNAAPNAPAWLVIGADLATAPLLGGFLGPAPTVVVGGLSTNAGGTLSLTAAWPAGVPSGARSYWQAWVLDGGAPHGVAATSTLAATAP